MADTHLPLIADYRSGQTFAWVAGERVCHAQALSQIESLAERLETGCSMVNSCADRYHFTIAFAAVCRVGGTNLMPSATTEQARAELRVEYPRAGWIDDAAVDAAIASAPSDITAEVPQIPADHRAAIVFTSGTTGAPQAHSKYWGDLVIATRLYRDRFFSDGRIEPAVATVPPGHMYGLETTVLPALYCGQAVAAERPFTPWAIRDAIADLPSPTLLITTPVHLRALVESSVDLPGVARVFSATAPLTEDLAATLEQRWGVEVCEIFGSTETGSIASRRTLAGDWQLYDEVRFVSDGQAGWQVTGPQLPLPVALGDTIERVGARGFRFLGRASDMLKVAGKRVSKAALEQALLSLDGVTDAVVLAPDQASRNGRPRALVVSDQKGPSEISAALAEQVDPVFVPRPLLCVEQLPRNEVGKLSRVAIEALFDSSEDQSSASVDH